jgi:formate hydrogenlyase subunit 3/multisubunit Na+/H+ antiporter MnhD subunit
VVPTVVDGFLRRVAVEIINPLIMLLAAGAFIFFLYGVVKFIMYAGDESKRSEGRQAIVWGLVGLVIIFGVYGILNLLTDTFGLDRVQRITQ